MRSPRLRWLAAALLLATTPARPDVYHATPKLVIKSAGAATPVPKVC